MTTPEGSTESMFVLPCPDCTPHPDTFQGDTILAPLAQTFQSSVDISLTKVELLMTGYGFNGNSADLLLQIGTSINPSGAVYSTSVTVPQFATAVASFAIPSLLINADVEHFLHLTYANQPTVSFVSWYSEGGDPYADGSAYNTTGSGLAPVSGGDTDFVLDDASDD